MKNISYKKNILDQGLFKDSAGAHPDRKNDSTQALTTVNFKTQFVLVLKL
jgi:hypothetical protein